MARRWPLAFCSIGATLILCAGTADAATFVAATPTQVLTFDSAAPQDILSQQTITGRGGGEFSPALAVGPDGTVFLLSHRGSDDALQLYTLDPATGAATPRGGPTTSLVPEVPNFGLDVDPVTGFLRVVTSARHNLQINPADGTVTQDTTLSRTGLSGIGFSNNVPGATSTSLLGIDDAANELVRIASPNDGMVTTIAPLSVDPPPAISFAIAPDGTAFLAMFEAGGTNLYTVNTSTGAAALVGEIGNNLNLVGIGARPSQPQAGPGPSPDPGPPPGTSPPPGPAGPTYDLWDQPIVDHSAGSVDPDADESPLVGLGQVRHSHPLRSQRSSAPTTYSFTIDPALPVSVKLTVDGRRQRGKCPSFPSGFECELEALEAPDGSAFVVMSTSFRSALDALGSKHTFRSDLACRPPAETDCSNNQLERHVVFMLSGDSALGATDARRLAGVLEGNSPPAGPRRAFQAAVAPGDRPRRADVAVLRLGRSQRGFSGAPNPLGTHAPGARSCSWLSSRGGRFRKTPVGARRTCESPIWLPARGARRWALRLRKPLPRGRYIVYSRAVTRAGATEQSFTRRDGNRKPLTVRRARGQ